MSQVTNVILQHNIMEESDIISCISFGNKDQRLRSLTNDQAGQLWGGSKLPETEIWAAAFNHVDKSEILRKLLTAGFDAPEDVRLMIEEHDDSSSGVYVLDKNEADELRWTCIMTANRTWSR